MLEQMGRVWIVTIPSLQDRQPLCLYNGSGFFLLELSFDLRGALFEPQDVVCVGLMEFGHPRDVFSIPVHRRALFLVFRRFLFQSAVQVVRKA